jgi:hypothetical protein
MNPVEIKLAAGSWSSAGSIMTSQAQMIKYEVENIINDFIHTMKPSLYL